MRRNPTPFALSVMLAALLAGGASVHAKKPGIMPACHVPGGYATIQAAVDEPECLSIVVGPGTYYENVVVRLRDVDIRGAGPEKTIVNGSRALAPVFYLDNRVPNTPNNDVTLEGMTITGGSGPDASNPQRNGGGISSARFNLTVKDCVITGNTAFGNGGGLSAVFGPVTVMRSVVTNNVAQAYPGVVPAPGVYFGGGGIRVGGYPFGLIVKHSVVAGNVSQRVGGGILAVAPTSGGSPPVPVPPGTLTLVNTLVTGNRALNADLLPAGGGGVFSSYTTNEFHGSDITANAPDEVAAP